MNMHSDIHERFTYLLQRDSATLFNKFLEDHNVPEKVKLIIEMCFDNLAPKCLANLMNMLPNYDKYIFKMFHVKKDSHFYNDNFKKFEKAFHEHYSELQEKRYKKLDQRKETND